jgi:hypothetical protein
MRATRRSSARWLAALFALGALYPKVAMACPVCSVDRNQRVLRVVALFLAVPFVLSLVVIRAIVRAQRNSVD